MNRRRRNKPIDTPFVPHRIEMLESPAYRALSRGGHRVLARLEIEHLKHGGYENGKLPVTFGDFEKYGMDPHSIAPAQREVRHSALLKSPNAEDPASPTSDVTPSLAPYLFARSLWRGTIA